MPHTGCGTGHRGRPAARGRAPRLSLRPSGSPGRAGIVTPGPTGTPAPGRGIPARNRPYSAGARERTPGAATRRRANCSAAVGTRSAITCCDAASGKPGWTTGPGPVPVTGPADPFRRAQPSWTKQARQTRDGAARTTAALPSAIGSTGCGPPALRPPCEQRQSVAPVPASFAVSRGVRGSQGAGDLPVPMLSAVCSTAPGAPPERSRSMPSRIRRTSAAWLPVRPVTHRAPRG